MIAFVILDKVLSTLSFITPILLYGGITALLITNTGSLPRLRAQAFWRKFSSASPVFTHTKRQKLR